MAPTPITAEEREDQFTRSFGNEIPARLTGTALEIETRLMAIANDASAKIGPGEREQTYVLAAMKATRRICTAWSKYPGVNEWLGACHIDSLSYLHTAKGAVDEEANGGMQLEIAKELGRRVAFAPEGTENEVLRQAVLAARSFHAYLYDMALNLGAFPDGATVEEEPTLATYSAILSMPTKEEVRKLTAKPVVYGSPPKKPSPSPAKKAVKAKRSRKTPNITPESPSSGQKAPASGKRGATASSKKRKAADSPEDADTTPQQPATKSRKTSKGKTDSTDDGDGAAKAPKSEEDGKDDSPSAQVDKARKARAKSNHETGPWLRDEEDMLFTMIRADPDRRLDSIYRELNERLSGTPYRNPSMPAGHYEHRTIWVPCNDPTLGRDAQRHRDQKWRSFEAIRNRVQALLKRAKDDRENLEVPKLFKENRQMTSQEEDAYKVRLMQRRPWPMSPINEAVGYDKADGSAPEVPPQGRWTLHMPEVKRDRTREAHIPYPGLAGLTNVMGMYLAARAQYVQSREQYLDSIASKIGAPGKSVILSAKDQYAESRHRYLTDVKPGEQMLRGYVMNQSDDEEEEEEQSTGGDVAMEGPKSDEHVAKELQQEFDEEAEAVMTAESMENAGGQE